MNRHVARWGMIIALTWGAGTGRAWAQTPTITGGEAPPAGGIGSSLGAMPGSGFNTLGSTPGTGSSTLSGGTDNSPPISGRLGATGPHVPSSVANPNMSTPNNQPQGFAAPQPTITFQAPSYGSYALPAGAEEEGPPNGLTLDLAIDRLVHENLDLRSKFFEIPQAQADILNAGLRSNPVLYADAQLVPYGVYTRNRPGGQTQYDLNVSYPLDVSRKRQARTLYATRAKRVIEAQYQDAVRLAIDLVYAAFVNVLAARQTVIYSQESVKGLTRLFEVTDELYRKDQATRADVSRVQVTLNTAQIGMVDAQEALRQTKRDLGVLLNIPPEQAEMIEVRGTIQDLAPPPPPAEELVNMALALRPDVVSYRLGIKAAEANVRLQMANRFPDVYVLYQPYTFQNNTPFGLKSATSWALGVTAPLPLYNRNQGGIARAKLNVTQSQVELARLENQVTTDVRKALREYEVTAQMVNRIRKELEPAARRVRDDTYRLYTGGEVNLIVFLNAQREYQDIVKQYLDTVVRHRRAMLALNTVLGQRVFP